MNLDATLARLADLHLASCRYCKLLVVAPHGVPHDLDRRDRRRLRVFEHVGRWELATGRWNGQFFRAGCRASGEHDCAKLREIAELQARSIAMLGHARRERRKRPDGPPLKPGHYKSSVSLPGPAGLAIPMARVPGPLRAIRRAVALWIAEHPDADPPGLFVRVDFGQAVPLVMMALDGVDVPMGVELDPTLETKPPAYVERLVFLRLDTCYRRLWELANGRG